MINVDTYNEMRMTMCSILENNYSMHIIRGELDKAYMVLGQLMAYKLIDSGDPRITKDNKMFRDAGIEKDHRFPLDYRNGRDYIPSWIFGNLEKVKSFKTRSIAHWGLRVEHEHEGYVEFKPSTYTIKCELCRTPSMLNNIAEAIYDLYNESNEKKMELSPLKTLIENGVCRVYRFDIDGNTIGKFKNIGYAVVSMGDAAPNVAIFPRYKTIIDNWLAVNFTVNSMYEIISSCISDANGIWSGSMNIEVAINPDRYVEEQAKKVVEAKEYVDNRIKERMEKMNRLNQNI